MMFRKFNCFLCLVFFVLLTSGCFFEDDEHKKYFKTFEYIKTDQFVWRPGLGGIYWINNDSLILEAIIKDENNIPRKGLYQIDMDGNYTLLVSLKNEGPYHYCFDGDNLYLRNFTGEFDVVNKSEGFGIVYLDNYQTKGSGPIQPVRCLYLGPPKKDGGYIALKKEDGFIKNSYMSVDDPDPYTYLSDNLGNEIKKLNVGEQKIVSQAIFLHDRNAYFFYKFDHDCSSLSWIYRDDWRVKTENICFGQWASHGGKTITSTKVGLYVENHKRSIKYKSYFIVGNKEYPLETTSSRRAVVAPDGCKIAYGSGEIGYGNNRFSQVLKIFDSCLFAEDKGN